MTTLSLAATSAASDRPIRVCFMIDRLTAAGTETQLLALIRCLDRNVVSPYLCLLDGEDEASRALEPAGCPVLRLGVRSFRSGAAVARLAKLVGFLRRERIDVLQAYFPDSTYFGVLAGCLAGVPRIVRTRNNLNHWMTPTHRRLGRWLNRVVAATVANSEPCRQAVIEHEGPAPESVIVLENGVDLVRFPKPAASQGARGHEGPRRVGVVANLRPVKGLDQFLEAAAIVAGRHPDVVFEVAGEGESRSALERRAAELGIADRFLLPGSIADVPGFLSRLDVAVLSSRAEGMPNAVLEYMAASRPIVATAVGGTVHLIDDETHGLLVPPEDPPAMARAVDRLLGDPALAAGLGEAARRRVERQFSREAMVHRFEAFYRQLVGRPIVAS